ncbi:hypothetical protein Nepgr_015669 [Nepenthes gracilis]|uniref:Uncharacterized protein n=1 Tax=Nepenthes gracilis TaxID=150966 RepID=A0AAD3XQW7_NEPGR|nr:hypothetical protein Nepgr_015669 [Nepenthes gracilis]
MRRKKRGLKLLNLFPLARPEAVGMDTTDEASKGTGALSRGGRVQGIRSSCYWQSLKAVGGRLNQKQSRLNDHVPPTFSRVHNSSSMASPGTSVMGLPQRNRTHLSHCPPPPSSLSTLLFDLPFVV